MKELSKEEVKHLGQSGICENCGDKDAIWTIDPYHEDVNQEQILVCLCEKCYMIYSEDI